MFFFARESFSFVDVFVMNCCSQCSRNPQEAIESRVEVLGETFLREYVQVCDVQNRFNL